MPKPSWSCRQLATAIESYLEAHPSAADSDQGVADWWLPELGIEAPLADVRDALELLKQEGTVEMQVMVDGRMLYRAGRARRGAPN